MNIKHLINKILQGLLLITALTLLNACSTDVGGNEDKTKPSVALTSLNNGEEVIGDFTITWATNEPNKSTVDIYISTDSGVTFNNADIVALNVPDTGSFLWKTNDITTLNDCRNCRLRIIVTDVVGNVSDPEDSQNDFVINNVPQVLGSALYIDVDNDGPGVGDSLRVPFDKELDLKTAIASDVFFFPVLGDGIGAFAEIATSDDDSSELIITMNDLGSVDRHLHIGGLFKKERLTRTASSGINLQDNISGGVLVARDTGRTAAITELGIDIEPTFSDSGQELGAVGSGSSGTQSVALADIDGDGDNDMVVGKFGLANRILLNNEPSNPGAGVFSDSGQLLGSSDTTSIALGDVDGDGDLDLVVGNDGGQANRVWLNGGDNSGSNTGVFIDSGQSLGSSATASIVLGDVDGDGDLDLVVGNDNGQANRVWLNGGDNSGSNTGVFIDSGQALGSSDTRSVALGDVDGDGDLDLVVGNDSGQANRVWLNGGDNSGSNTGVFIDSGQALSSNASTSVVLGDVDGDDDLDLVVGNDSGQANRVWLNGGDNLGSNTGVYIDSGQALGSNASTSVVLGDVDGDGDIDLVVGNVGRINANRVWLNSGNNAVYIDSGQSLGSGVTKSVVLSDVDSDGDLDLVVGNGGVDLVWLNSLRHASQYMVDSGQALGSSETFEVALGDVDGDGDLDLVAGNRGSANLVWLNGGDNSASNTGVFSDSGQTLALGSSFTDSVILGDVDGDGDLDLVEGNRGPANLVWLNGGDNSGSNTGLFIDSGQLLGAGVTQSVTLGDVDGDGDLDLVVGNASNQANRVWLNGGDNSGSNTGVFIDSGQSLGTSATASIVLGDVDGDGDLDMVTGNVFNQANRVWLNGGDNSGSNTGVFSDSGQALGSNVTSSVALGDVDGDGDLDLVVGNAGRTDANRVWLNGGDNSGSNTGVFSDSGQMLGDSSTGSLILGDMDGDGDLDLVAGNAGGATLVWFNGGDSSGSNTGVFSDSGQVLGSSSTISVALGDVDGDGDIDFVTGNFDKQANRVWLNDFGQ